jgi:hypothetical protein
VDPYCGATHPCYKGYKSKKSYTSCRSCALCYEENYDIKSKGIQEIVFKNVGG